MFKKCFAVASIATVNLVFAFTGCSSTTTVTDNGTDAGKKETSSSSSSGNVPEAGPPVDSGPGTKCPPDAISTTQAQFDQLFGFKLPVRANPPVCTEADIKTMETNFTGAQKWTDLVKNIAKPCADCLLTPKDGANYGPIVTINADGSQGFSNFGACSAYFTQQGGGSASDAESCGKALNYTELCLREACDCADGKGDAAESACIRAAISGACRSFSGGLSACKLSSAQEDWCNSLLNGGRTLCAGQDPVNEGGAD